MQPIRSVATLIAMALCASLLMLSGAMAHAGLLSSEPADGSVLPGPPAELLLVFNEPVSPLAMTLVSPGGDRPALADAASDGERVRLALPDGLAEGTHLVSWRVVSADGHPVGGALVFSIGTPGTPPSLADGADRAVTTAIWLVRTTLYAALFVGTGIALFGVTVAPVASTLAHVSATSATVGIALAILALGLQGLDALGLGLAALFTPDPWVTAASTSYAATVLSASVACLATLASWRVASCSRRALVVLAWGAAALAPVLSGHAGTAPPTWLSRPAVFLHIAGIVFWIGAMLPLGRLMLSPVETASPALTRFSRLIPLAIAPVVVSGIVLAVLQMGPPGPSWQSPYALLLAGKLALLLALFGLAAWNRLALTRPAVAGESLARDRLRRSIGIELVLVLAVFAIVAGWRFTPPPRVLAEIAARPMALHIHTPAAMADITVTPGRAGASTMRIWLTDGEFVSIVPKSVSVSLSNPDLGIERLQRDATLEDDGFWTTPLLTPAGGVWTVELGLRIDDFSRLNLTGQLDLAD